MSAAVVEDVKVVNGGGHVQSMKAAAAANATWNDWPFAVLFLAHVGAIVAVVVTLGIPILSSTANDTSTNSIEKTLAGSDMRTILAVAGALAVIATLVAFLLLQFVVAYASRLIRWSLLLAVYLNVGFAVFAAVAGLIWMTIVFAICSGLALCYLRLVRNRIPFAAANLQVAAAAVKHNMSTFPLAFGLMAVQIVWFFLWTIALLGIIKSVTPVIPNPSGLSTGSTCKVNSDCQSDMCRKISKKSSVLTCQPLVSAGEVLGYFFMLVSFFWGVNVIKNVLHTTVAGTVASWWMAGDPRKATAGAFRRATTTSFGSICLGSLLVAILQAMETVANEAKSRGDWVACVAECFLKCLRGIMEWINRWAFVYVGIYGFKFFHAGKSVFTLFSTRGLSAVVNDDLIGHCMGFMALSNGLICALLGLAYTCVDKEHTAFPGGTVIFPIIGLAVGIGVALIPLSVIDSAVATVFVCFAEDPAAFAQTHPELYTNMVAAWRIAHPDAMLAFLPV
ncbi:Aste57867_22102 [Aphanomyces stellatus]|uniref:Choline transporter-like protein n=1 Tax=Aphanomyces stellatus TaxID=120398 RepID=A0A485LKP1_9STRA|nr:hypothetical protein As57867_022033 [Aphanomyces stellatus]VFT98770.1 Aste57867_22102 [Aphanomyces stellatus]